MTNLLRKILKRQSIGKLPTKKKKQKMITHYSGSQLRRSGILHPPDTTTSRP
jgi:hypothetical protein